MNNNSYPRTATNTIISSSTFESLDRIENGLVIKNKKKEEIKIEYSALFKIYIRKCKLNLYKKIGILSLLLLLIPALDNYLPIELIIFAIGILAIPMMVKLNNYIQYQLVLQDYEGAIYKRNFGVKTKQEHINLINIVRKEIFQATIDNNTIQPRIPKEDINVIDEKQVFSALSIA